MITPKEAGDIKRDAEKRLNDKATRVKEWLFKYRFHILVGIALFVVGGIVTALR